MFPENGIEPDELTVVSVLKACTHKKDIDPGRLVHCYVIKRSFSFDIFVGNSLIDMYLKCLYATSAFEGFYEMPQKNAVSWNSILSGFVHNECLYVVSAELKRCKWAHGLAIRSGLTTEVAVGTASLDMYSKYGKINLSRRMFDQIPERNIVSWSATIDSYGMDSRAKDAMARVLECL
ncbi:Pentatricopeptide repeat [Macleaya cordata]|uniref:Pentatricopeptide repeat n=1 Tax=Macleaya cordata TaxID=56857 RepID=A0A200PQX2_MACCD|nr:Pentatricopeptide repeat [Macleaya cordata]